VELFIAPKGRYARHYDEIELGPRGHFLDLKVDRLSGAGDTTWSSGVEVKTTVDDTAHRAVIEARIPAPEIVAALKPGAQLPLGLFRIEGKDKRLYLAWSPPNTGPGTRTPDFHVFEAFGTLVID
jgi:hypothetical protein